jgi:hypothetical protein
MRVRDLEYRVWESLPRKARIPYCDVMEAVEGDYETGTCPIDEICEEIMMGLVEILDEHNG